MNVVDANAVSTTSEGDQALEACKTSQHLDIRNVFAITMRCCKPVTPASFPYLELCGVFLHIPGRLRASDLEPGRARRDALPPGLQVRPPKEARSSIGLEQQGGVGEVAEISRRELLSSKVVVLGQVVFIHVEDLYATRNWKSSAIPQPQHALQPSNLLSSLWN